MTKDEALRTNKFKASTVTVADGSKFAGAVFLYMFIALAITAGVAAIMGLIFSKAVYTGADANANMDAFVKVIIIALCLYFPIMIWVEIAAVRKGKTLIPAFVSYSIVMGVLISSFTIFLPFWIIAVAFGLTCLTFGVMALIAWTTKRSLSGLAVAAMGLLIGACIMAIVNLIITLVSGFNPLYWIISYVLLAVVVLITIIDLRNVKEIAERGGADKNVALMCALSLYVDFIYIFLRILIIVAKIYGSSRN